VAWGLIPYPSRDRAVLGQVIYLLPDLGNIGPCHIYFGFCNFLVGQAPDGLIDKGQSHR